MSVDLEVQNLLTRSEEELRTKKYPEARRTLQEAIKNFPDLPKKERSRLLSLVGRVSYWMGDYESAKRDINLALQLNAKNDLAHLVAGKIALAEFLFTKAQGHLTSVSRPNGEADLAMCRLCLRLRDTQKANEYLRVASLTIPPSHPEWKLMQAYIRVLNGSNQQGIREAMVVKKDLDLSEDPDVLIILAELLTTAGDFTTAETILKGLQVQIIANDQIYGLFAYCAFYKENYEEAQGHVSSALERNPKNAYALTIQSKLAARRGDLAEAERIAHSILTQTPEYVLAHANLGDIYFLQGRYDFAKSAYEAADEYMQTDTKGSKLRQARLAIMGNDLKRAQDILEKLVDVHGTYYDDALADLMLVYEKMGLTDAKAELIARMEMRREFSPRIDEMLQRIAEGEKVKKM